MRLFLGGVNGAGKTTLLQNIKVARPEFEIVKGSQEFMRFLGIDGDYEALRALDEPYKLAKLEEMLKELFARHENLIFDAHYLNLVRGTTNHVTGLWIKDFDALLLLKVSAQTVIKRTAGEGRDRALFPAGLTKEQEFEMLKDYVRQYDQEFEHLCSQYHVQGKVLDGEKSPKEILDEFLVFVEQH